MRAIPVRVFTVKSEPFMDTMTPLVLWPAGLMAIACETKIPNIAKAARYLMLIRPKDCQ